MRVTEERSLQIFYFWWNCIKPEKEIPLNFEKKVSICLKGVNFTNMILIELCNKNYILIPEGNTVSIEIQNWSFKKYNFGIN